MLHVVIASAIAVLLTAWLLWRFSRRPNVPRAQVPSSTEAQIDIRPEFPPAGRLVPEGVLRSAGSTSGAIWDALQAAAVPIAVEYRPVTASEIATFRTVLGSTAAQQALVGIVKALDRMIPPVYLPTDLPRGVELVKAVGKSGVRGFSRTGGKTAHAVWKPVPTGAIATVIVGGGTLLAARVLSRRKQVAHQQEEERYIERINDQRSANQQLTLAASLMLDGRTPPPLERALKSADDEFNLAKLFLDRCGVIDRPAEEGGRVDYRRLEEALGGKATNVGSFDRELHLARTAIEIKRKALVAHAASAALADVSNPHTALRQFLDAEAHQWEQADSAVAQLTEQLGAGDINGRWHNAGKSVADRQTKLRGRIAPTIVDDTAEVFYAATGSGDILQVLPPDEATQPVLDANTDDA